MNYFLKRLALVPITLFCIVLINFVFVQFAPGGPVEQMIAKISGTSTDATAVISGSGAGAAEMQTSAETSSKYRGAQGLDPEFIAELEKQFGFDRPAHVRFWTMIKGYLTFDLGESFYRNESVVSIIASKLPVSMSIGIWSTLLIYLIAIPLGIYKAKNNGSLGDNISSFLMIIGYAVPSFLFAVFLIVVFCGGNYLDWFPLRGLTSSNFDELGFWGKVKDYFWHLVLPVTAMAIGGIASLVMLTKNSFIEELTKPYVVTAKAKGLSANKVLYGHVFRNAMLIVIAGFPATLVTMLFTGSVLIEVIFSLDGIGRLGYESIINRDYPIIFGTLYIFGLLGLLLNIISDFTYTLVDPRIDFEKRHK